ncbi:MAG: metallophosphoesterase [Prevotellaceae bacterium]|jgi:hypothetical protein|nr:metallophosphoesterase [Prevotellaceae bacterium]
MKAKHLFFLTAVTFQSCYKFEYHAYDGRIEGDVGINARNIARIEDSCRGKTTIRFAAMGDTQRRYDETADFVVALNSRSDVDFVIHGGDISDFGLTREFMWMRDIMSGLEVPYVALLGSHDCLANGAAIYRKVFGEENFSFLAGSAKFVCLNTNAPELDDLHPVPDLQFMETRLSERSAGHEQTVVAMHAPPHSEPFNNSVAAAFQQTIKKFPGLQLCLNAHEHRVSAEDRFGDGVIYHGSPDIAKRQYLLFTLTSDGYSCEVVQF